MHPDHAHAHAHGHAHSHAPSADADRRWISVALALICAFMLVELVAGLLANSVALLSDAAHMLTDAGSLGLALWAARLATRPPGGAFTFGFGRAEVLSAQVNGALLLVLAGALGVEAARRLGNPSHVHGTPVLVVGLVGALANLAAAAALARAERTSLNVAGARAHVLTDLWASLGAALAGLLILTTGFERADSIAALLVSALMLRSAWQLLRDSGRVLLEAAPVGVDPQEIGGALARERGVVEVHDLHVWELTAGFAALAAHVLVAPGDDCHATRRRLELFLADRFGISHTTLQVDHEHRDELLHID